MQVEFIVHTKMAASKFAQHSVWHTGSTERDFLAGLKNRRVGDRLQAFAQYGLSLGAREVRFGGGLRLGADRLSGRFAAQGPHIARRIAEQLVVVHRRTPVTGFSIVATTGYGISVLENFTQ